MISEEKHKSNGKICSNENMRKCHDATMFGAKTVGHLLPSAYYSKMENFQNSFKKEYRKEKEEGNADEKSADAIPFLLFRLMCNWFLLGNNIFCWVWTITQWNLMASCISVGPSHGPPQLFPS